MSVFLESLTSNLSIWIIVALYIVLMFWVAISSFIKTKKAASTTNGLTQFVVGGRSAGPWVSAFAYGTTYFSAVMFVGYAGRSGWDYGLLAILVGVGNALLGTWLAWVVLADRTRDVTRRLKIKTMPQLFQKRYSSNGMKIYSALLIFIFMIPYSASVYSGLSYIIESVLHIDYNIAMLAIAAIAALYLVVGGYVASLLADFIQGIIMIGGVIAMIFAVLNSNGGTGLEINPIEDTFAAMQSAGLTNLDGTQIFNFIALILLTSVGTWGMPQMIHKFYGVADKKAIKRGTIISTLFCLIISVGAYFVGSISRAYFTPQKLADDFAGNKDLLIPNLLIDTLPQILLGVIIILILSASVSTLSGLTLTSCSTISMDLVAGELVKNMKPKNTLHLTRILCLLFIVASYLIATFKTPILTLMSFSWGIIAGAFLSPYILGLFFKKMNKYGSWAGLISGPLVCITLAIIWQFDASLASIFGISGIVVSFISCIVVSLLTQNLSSKDSNYMLAKERFYDKTFTLQNEEVK